MESKKNQSSPQPSVATDSMLPQQFEVARFLHETSDTFTLELIPSNWNSGYHFKAGQFNMLYVFGVGEVPISISGDPNLPGKLIHTIRAVGAVTNAMRELKAGHFIGVRGPYGSAWPVEITRGNDVVIVGGGIGLAPLRPAIYHVLANRESYGKIVLLYGTRTPEDILYRKELGNWRSRFDLEVDVTVDRVIGSWQGHVGVVTKLIPRATFDPYNTIALVCGPEVMMRYTILELQKTGVENDQIYISMERNMKCGIGLCGHCQYGPMFICKDGPVFRFDQISELFRLREL